MLVHTIDGTAEIIGSGRSKVYELIGEGKIKAKKRGRFTIILDEDLNEYLRNLPDAVEAGAIRAATPDTPDENPPPRRASEQEGRTGTRPSRNPQSRHDKDGGAATRSELSPAEANAS
jgi:excisionase family DNA binding protein